MIKNLNVKHLMSPQNEESANTKAESVIEVKTPLVNKAFGDEVYQKPESFIIELVSEGIMCSSGIDAGTNDPRWGDEGNWPGFDNENRF